MSNRVLYGVAVNAPEVVRAIAERHRVDEDKLIKEYRHKGHAFLEDVNKTTPELQHVWIEPHPWTHVYDGLLVYHRDALPKSSWETGTVSHQMAQELSKALVWLGVRDPPTLFRFGDLA
jgi:hypothetical protein